MIVIDCPVPPSANRLWRVGRGRVYKSKKYRRWQWEFMYQWSRQKPRGFTVLKERFDAEILICPQRARDADASAKATLDTIQAVGIIVNDSQARFVTQGLVDKTQAPMGCRLRIIPLGQSAP